MEQVDDTHRSKIDPKMHPKKDVKKRRRGDILERLTAPLEGKCGQDDSKLASQIEPKSEINPYKNLSKK